MAFPRRMRYVAGLHDTKYTVVGFDRDEERKGERKGREVGRSIKFYCAAKQTTDDGQFLWIGG